MSSGKNTLTKRDRSILEHIGRYRLSFQEVIERLYFKGADSQKVLDRLRDSGFIASEKGFGGNRSAYVLKPKGVAARGLPRRTADELGSQSMPDYLAVLSFCCLMGKARIVLLKDELKELFEHEVPKGRYHCLERADSSSLYHVSIPGPTKREDAVVAATRSHVARMLGSKGLSEWVTERLYQYAILVDSAERARAITKAMDGAEDDNGQLLRSRAAINVFHIPGSTNFSEVLRVL
jgi:hypothetical protein